MKGERQMQVNGAVLSPTVEGALFWPDESLLVVSDLHFEKGSSFAERGVMLPPYDTRATLKKLAAVVERLKPARVLSLGDAFHDRRAEGRMDEADADTLERLIGAAEWIWVLGNHDPAPPRRFGGEVALAKRIGPLIFRHEPTAGAAPGEVAGHLHPCARVVTESRIQRRRCFATDGERLVMPAFGAYTGGLNVLDAAFANVFAAPAAWVIGRRLVYPIANRLLVEDPQPAVRIAG